jgi:hypothetical protein
MKVKGKTHAEIGKAVDRCRDTVGRILKTEEARDILQACHAEIVRKAPAAVRNIIQAVDGFDEAYKAGDKVKTGISWDATKLVTSIPGLTPTSTPSIIHQTFINQQTNILDPMISNLIARHLSDVVDITPSINIEEGVVDG